VDVGVAVKPKLELVAPDAAPAPEPTRFPDDLPTADMVSGMYRRHRDLVFHLALRYGNGHRAWAEDVLHDVFVRLLRHVHRVNRLDNPHGWFYRVTTNVCLTRLRRERFLTLPVVRWVVGQPRSRPAEPEQLGIDEERLRRAFVRLAALPPKVRACVYMHHVDGMPQAEIAEMLGHSRGYVSKLIARGEAALSQLDAEDSR
jgi:RNA polymerase sigma-70 factor (ECF subfamily)